MAIWYAGAGGAVGNTGQSYAQRKALVSQLTLANLDTVYLCANAAGAGSRWVNTEQLNVVSGVTYRVYPGHYVLMHVPTSAGGYAINGTNVSNVVVEPTEGFLELGDITQWNPNDANFGHSFASIRQLNFSGTCTNVHLIGTGTGEWATTNSNFVVHGGNDWDGNQFWQSCSLFLIRGLDVWGHGTNSTIQASGGTIYDDSGDIFVTYGDRFFIEKCCFKRGGHSNLTIKSRRTVVRTCDGDGDCTGSSSTSPRGTANARPDRGGVNARSGMRAYNIIPGDQQHAALSPYGPVLIEDCIFQKSGSAADQKDNVLTKLDGTHIICRYNYFWDGVDSALINATHDDFTHNILNYLKIYNNTFYRTGRIIIWGTDATLPATIFNSSFAQGDFLNNLFDEGQGAFYWNDYAAESESYKGAAFRRLATGEPNDLGWPNEWKGGRIDGNIVRNGSGALGGANVQVHISYFAGGGNVINFDAMDTSFPSNWGAGNVMGTAPTYAGNPASGARTKATFAQNGGIAIGNAVPLAFANGAGSSSTTLTVDSGQARMFFDGWNMESLGLTPDWIKIGTGAPVQIAANGINEGATTITLSAARSWNDNDEVCHCLTPDGVNFTVVEDIGAAQTAGPTIPATGVDGYIILIGTVDATGTIFTPLEERDVGNVLTYTFTGLTTAQQYYFRIRAYDLAGNLGAYSSPRILATPS